MQMRVAEERRNIERFRTDLLATTALTARRRVGVHQPVFEARHAVHAEAARLIEQPEHFWNLDSFGTDPDALPAPRALALCQGFYLLHPLVGLRCVVGSAARSSDVCLEFCESRHAYDGRCDIGAH